MSMAPQEDDPFTRRLQSGDIFLDRSCLFRNTHFTHPATRRDETQQPWTPSFPAVRIRSSRSSAGARVARTAVFQ